MKVLTVIYGLFDPRSPSVICYVGKTITGSRARRSCHIQDARNGSKLNVAKWIRQLTAEGIQPDILEIEECTIDNLNEREIFHIARLRSEGVNLLNMTRGGTGGPTMTGRKFTPEHRQRIASALYDHPVSDNSRRKASERLSRLNKEGKVGRPFQKGCTPHNKGFKG